MQPTPDTKFENLRCNTLLVGAGVVGRAIALDHLLAKIPVWMADRDAEALSASCDWVLQRTESVAESAAPWGAKIEMPIVHIRPASVDAMSDGEEKNWLLIESIAERLDIKQSFFSQAESWFDRPPILTTNTSTLSIEKIAEAMQRPERLCGLHFFMPVVDRHAVEIINHPRTDAEVLAHCEKHAERLGKRSLRVKDGPGFVVNRMLSSYINLSMWLLCGGVEAKAIEQAALDYGMPMSPMSLVDLIGPRTAFDGGRTVWSAFPHRMDPSPLLPALIKRKLTGVAGGAGFYRYDVSGKRVNEEVTAEAKELIERYRHNELEYAEDHESTVGLVRSLFAATFRIEANAIEKDGIADEATIEQSMRHGLACESGKSTAINSMTDQEFEALARQYPHIKSIQLPSH